jgi:hypothetical protein
LKIGGVVSDYKEAQEIEEAVKVFIIKQRIFNLLSLEKKKKIKKNDNPDSLILSTNNEKYNEISDEKILPPKNIEYPTPRFNVRGLV